eukprot:scaffold52462_cov41-Prasinocladus_malaysianus.AAC.1
MRSTDPSAPAPTSRLSALISPRPADARGLLGASSLSGYCNCLRSAGDGEGATMSMCMLSVESFGPGLALISLTISFAKWEAQPRPDTSVFCLESGRASPAWRAEDN